MTNNTPTSPASSAGASASGKPGPWILVVDDEPSIRRLIEFLLRSQGYDVTTADGATQAMDVLRDQASAPSLVICDVLMPGIDGLELVRRMCARVKGLNVIFISGHLTDVSWWPEDLKDHRFLPKPFENAQLLGAVKEAIGDGAV